MIGVYTKANKRFWFGRDVFGHLVGPWEEPTGYSMVLGGLHHSLTVRWQTNDRDTCEGYLLRLDALRADLRRQECIVAADGDDVPEGFCLVQRDWLRAAAGFHVFPINDLLLTQIPCAVTDEVLDNNHPQIPTLDGVACALGAASVQARKS